MKTRTRIAHALLQPRSSHHGNDQMRTREATIIESCPSRTSSSTQSARSQAQSKIRLKIIQQQAGHEYASTTAIYTCVSSDFRTRTLRNALDATARAVLRPGKD
jgi:integrase/recombinase XerC